LSRATREDPVKAHREGTALVDSRKYEEAVEKFLKASEFYWKAGDFFDSCYTLFKAAECSFFLKNYETAAERFLKAAEKSLERGYDRLGLSALEYANDCYKAVGEEETEKATSLMERIAEIKKKIEAQSF
jgi:tetratricopeptide (TPR) repeat protein